MKKTQGGKRKIGERMVKEFAKLDEALRAGRPVENIFTLRTVDLDLKPKEFDPESVRLIRMSLGVSQAIFAEIVGASKDLVEKWEQGHRAPSPMACRLFELIERDKLRWLELLEQAMKKDIA